jgi:hypothetical protein
MTDKLEKDLPLANLDQVLGIEHSIFQNTGFHIKT